MPKTKQTEVKIPYFGKQVEQAIIEYNKETWFVTREKLYNNIIYPALHKLVENVIHNRKMYEYGTETYASTKMDCVTYLTNRLYKYTEERGAAFSYFNRITINFLIQNKKKIDKQHLTTSSLQYIDQNRDLFKETWRSERADDLQDFVQKWAEWGIENLDELFPKVRDRRIADAIFMIFKNCHYIDNYDKKTLYIMIREQVNTKTQYITEIIKYLRELQSEMFIEYKNSDTRKWKYFLIKED
jgi:hypothetical protein